MLRMFHDVDKSDFLLFAHFAGYKITKFFFGIKFTNTPPVFMRNSRN